MASFGTEKCILCKKEFENTNPTSVQRKGYETLLRISRERNMPELTNELEQMVENGCQILVHFDCRRKFTDTRKKGQSKLLSKKLRSSYDVFNWKEHCFLCEKVVDLRHSEKRSIFNVRTLPLRDNLIACAKEREDGWGDLVLGRLESCNDLVAEEAVYHSACMTKFRLKKSTEKKKGKPVDQALLESFESVCEWLEKKGDCELHTIKELQDRMKDSSKTEAYSAVYMKKKLKERYNSHVYFAEICGLADVICFKEMANFIIKEKKRSKTKQKTKLLQLQLKLSKLKLGS